MEILDLRREPSAGVALPGFGVAEVPFLGVEEFEARSFRNCSLFIVVGWRALGAAKLQDKVGVEDWGLDIYITC